MMGPRTKVLLLGTTLALGMGAPAAAHTPDPDVTQLAGLELNCAGETVTFTSGVLQGTQHVHAGRRGGEQLVFSLRLRDASLITDSGDVLRAVGSATNSSVYRGTSEVGTFTANFTLIGPQGQEGALHLLVRGEGDDLVAIDRGTCQIAW